MWNCEGIIPRDKVGKQYHDKRKSEEIRGKIVWTCKIDEILVHTREWESVVVLWWSIISNLHTSWAVAKYEGRWSYEISNEGQLGNINCWSLSQDRKCLQHMLMFSTPFDDIRNQQCVWKKRDDNGIDNCRSANYTYCKIVR